MRSAMSFIVLFILFFLFSGCGSTTQKNARYNPATMRTYHVLGKTYHPTYVSTGQKMKGVASWYGPNFHGKMTSNGEQYSMYDKTVAHKTWPMNTMLKITNLRTNKSTVARINDRGPFVTGRIVDCSYTVGKTIGIDQVGTAPVEIEVIGFHGEIQAPKAQPETIRLSNFGVQVGAFRRYAGAQIYQEKYSIAGSKYNTIIKTFDEGGAPLYRVWVMGFDSEDEARDFMNQYKPCGGFIVRE